MQGGQVLLPVLVQLGVDMRCRTSHCGPQLEARPPHVPHPRVLHVSSVGQPRGDLEEEEDLEDVGVEAHQGWEEALPLPPSMHRKALHLPPHRRMPMSFPEQCGAASDNLAVDGLVAVDEGSRPVVDVSCGPDRLLGEVKVKVGMVDLVAGVEQHPSPPLHARSERVKVTLSLGDRLCRVLLLFRPSASQLVFLSCLPRTQRCPPLRAQGVDLHVHVVLVDRESKPPRAELSAEGGDERLGLAHSLHRLIDKSQVLRLLQRRRGPHKLVKAA
eukprot:679914-Hanusia_phi.AAC.1